MKPNELSTCTFQHTPTMQTIAALQTTAPLSPTLPPRMPDASLLLFHKTAGDEASQRLLADQGPLIRVDVEQQ